MRWFYFVSSAKRNVLFNLQHLGVYWSTNEPKMRTRINGALCKNYNIIIHYVNTHNLITDELNMGK